MGASTAPGRGGVASSGGASLHLYQPHRYQTPRAFLATIWMTLLASWTATDLARFFAIQQWPGY